jgi:hypothetical protein
MAAAKPPIALSAYNHQDLAHEAELARRRYQSYERSHRAAAEALRMLRGYQQQDSSDHGQEKAGKAVEA